MKKSLIIFFFLTSALYSQILPGGGINYFEQENNKSSYYLSGDAKIADLYKDWGLDAGIRAGMIFSNNLTFGFSFYYLLTNNIDINLEGFKRSYINLAYGGLDLGYLYNVSDKIQLEAHTIAGWSHIGFQALDSSGALGDLGGSWAAILEPQVGAYLHIWNGFYFGAQAGYRFFFFGKSDIIDIKELNGVMGSLSIKAIAF